MKRMICILLFISILLLSGCSRPESTFQTPVYFYYPRIEVNLHSQDGVISYEIREGDNFTSEKELLDEYLKGPNGFGLYSPFPVSCSVIDCTVDGSRICVQLSNDFDQLVGLPFTVATSCIAMTLLSSTNLKSVEINILNKDYTVERSITLTKDLLLFEDTYVAPPAE